ncbi:hypothetical protein BBO99_00000392 [Phytophthora kernoviae]|uniref:Dynein heavy chain coiled coil stalk domain-containing protein n=2 Tax=Phytophthora kernoviae TaxID=325452 RepID=A0A3R7JU33_9STRA|nr:hypothetical protein G195_001226 [Phytophthora kernoviae 00238/432]KAG2532248.1 hypothetical protein JM16_000442 [Phytophthora kernoviae]RLN14582.1 hypothetical protein BBI17_000425 [Phytophthora kernoviae]RLN85617.1 hypothetical protein BBO99_00000392 [Phytophthora kernoviae]
MYAKSYGRHNYVTPTSFLELIRFYRSLLESKRSSQTLKIKRLEVGLATLKKTSLDVAGLQDELKQTMKKVDERKRATELLLEQMGKQRGDAEVKQRRADEERAKAAQAAEIASQIEAQASVELAIAKPALDATQQAVNCLNKASLTELKSMGKPPAGVEKVTAAVLMMVKKETKNFSWDNAKKMMAKVDVFKQSLEQYDKENIPPDVVARVEPLIQEDPNFNYEKMKSKSVAAANLCVWVVNIISFHQVYVRVKPLMDTLEKARQTKAEADSELAMVQKMVAEVESESIDASLEPVIMRQVYKKGRTWFLQFAGEEIEVDPRFRLYLHTKLPNPHYRPEILAYCTLIDFSVTEKGLEDQLLANVVNLEQPDLETQKRQLQQEFNGYQIQLLMLENDLLERLSNAPEDILSDVPLIQGLEKTKLTAIDVAIALRKGKDTEREINIAREVYRPVANEANVVADVDKLAVKDQERIKGVDYHNIALGQGQEQVAMRTLQMSVESGHWIILNNVHLMPKWMLELDKWLEQLAKASKSTSYATFRNNLSSSNDVARMPTSRDPSPNIPIGVLERSIKLTNEPPTGLRANVKRAFCCFPKTVVDELEPRTRCILFGLCYFHSLMLERKKFGPQGFNMLYPFAVSDLLASSTVLRNYMDNAPARVPWPDLRYLFGEIILLEIMTDSLAELELGFRGDVPMTEAMERLQTCLYYERVPDNWLAAACPSRRSLAPWLANLQQRIAQLQEWISSAPDLPLVLWLPGLFNPQAFLTAVLQTAARKHGVELDSLRITADVTKRTVDTVDAPARDGQFVHGLYLEGARWDLGNSVLEGSIPREMYVTMPVLTCRAIVNTVNKDSSGGSSGGNSSKQGGVGGTGNIFECPVYRTQQRGPTLIFVSPLRTKVPPAKWVLAGVAMLMEVV